MVVVLSWKELDPGLSLCRSGSNHFGREEFVCGVVGSVTSQSWRLVSFPEGCLRCIRWLVPLFFLPPACSELAEWFLVFLQRCCKDPIWGHSRRQWKLGSWQLPRMLSWWWRVFGLLLCSKFVVRQAVRYPVYNQYLHWSYRLFSHSCCSSDKAFYNAARLFKDYLYFWECEHGSPASSRAVLRMLAWVFFFFNLAAWCPWSPAPHKLRRLQSRGKFEK